MASLRKTPAGSYIICFRYNGGQNQRALKTKNPDAAKAMKGRVEHTMFRIASGDLAIPSGVDAADFIVWGDAALERASQRAETKRETPSLEESIEPYLDAHRGLKDDSSLRTERSHLRNLKRCLNSKAHLPIDRLGHNDLSAVLRQRLGEAEGTTVKKERQTYLSYFDWAVKSGKLKCSPATDLPTIKSSRDRPPFRTLEEMEEIVSRGGLSDKEAVDLWECLYLNQEEIGEILSLVRQGANDDFVHPMFALAAYTGMRRGEIILRLRWIDVNFSRHIITARSKKQSRQQSETSREIDMHPELQEILRSYQKRRPKGQQVICFGDTFLPLTVHKAHRCFQRALRGTRWERKLPSGKNKIIIGFHSPERTLESLVRRHSQQEVPCYEDLERSLLRAARDGAPGQLDTGLRDAAIATADATMAVFGVLWQEAYHIALEHGVDESTVEEFGPLSMKFQVQGAIALRRAAQLGFRLDDEAVDRVVQALEVDRQRYEQDLMRDHEARRCFRLDQGNMRFRNEFPEVKMKHLRSWLDGFNHAFRGPYGIPLPLRTIAEDTKAAAVPEEWGSLRMADRSLRSWSDLVTVSKNLRFLRPKHGGAVRPKYSVLERISSVEPDKESLHDLLNRNILLDRNGKALIVMRFQDLELRALAAICRWWYGQSRLAELFEEDVDVYQYVAEALAESDLGDIGTIGSRTAQRLESWKRVAKAHILAIGLKLGDKVASKIVRHGYDVPLNAAAAPRITARICELFPELREYTQDDTIDVLAQKLMAEPKVRAWWELVTGRNVTPADVRQAICGYKMNRLKRGLSWDIVRLNQNSDLRALFNRHTCGPEVEQAIFAKAQITPTGRVRGPCPFCEATAEYLDLADDAVKAALFALARIIHMDRDRPCDSAITGPRRPAKLHSAYGG